MSMTEMVRLDRLTKRFGPLCAVDDISLVIGRGEVLGFLGPNGAGKSTTMRMLTGFVQPTSGTASVMGHDIATDSIEARKRIGYLPEGAPLYADMTVAGFLAFIAGMRGLRGGEKAQRTDAAVAKTQLAEVLHRPIETLSKGFKRRVGLAQAILHDPPVLVLDEPTDGLDPNQKHEVRLLIRDMAAHKAIVISTHILEEVDALCTRAVVIARGRIVADATPEELRRRSRYHQAVRITLDARLAQKLESVLGSLPEVAAVEPTGSVNGVATLRVLPKVGSALAPAVNERIRATGLDVDELVVEQGHLDEVFRELTLPAH
jgi:ABC-2 type transport system ATP-binding protein